MLDNEFAQYDFTMISLINSNLNREGDITKVDISIEVKFNRSITTTKRDNTPYSDRTQADGTFYAISNALLVSPLGIQWETDSLPNANANGMAWSDKSHIAHVFVKSDTLTQIDEGSIFTFSVHVHDRKADCQEFSFVYRNEEWRKTSKTAVELLNDNATPKERRVRQ